MPSIRLRGLLVGAVLLCGSCKSTGQAAGVAASSGAQLTGDPAIVAIATQARASLAAAKFVHKVVTTQDANPLVESTTFAKGLGATGTIGIGESVVKFVYVGGTMYVQGSQQAFEAMNVRLSAAQWTIIAGKWINVTADDGNLGPFADFVANIPTDFPTVLGAGTLSAAAPGTWTIGGKQAVAFLDLPPGEDYTRTVYVSAGPDRLPLRIQPTVTPTPAVDTAVITTDFDDYDVPVAIVAPPSAITTSDVLVAR